MMKLTKPSIDCLLFACLMLLGFDRAVQGDDALDFFESKIRPVLLEHCVECHSLETEASGGLLLDSRSGWQAGGDSGAAIVPGDAGASQLLIAISYDDPDLQMPPDGKLSAAILSDFSSWIGAGAVDPRLAARPLTKQQVGLLVEQAQEHWAYRDVGPVRIPHSTRHATGESSASPVDAFIDQRLAEAGLDAAPPASWAVLARRLYFDLIGLPPTPEELQSAIELLTRGEQGYQQLVDRLLRTPHYGEHFARKWMDVARYADSVTLRGLVFPEAWRYRDYLIESFTQDRPFDQMIREQVAGDLLPYESLAQWQRQLVATGFLVMGNSNLEQQDKTQLEMDYIDEQLEVIGHAFLGQTIGCARCHDHKFDPIPTRDYYALAGILRSAVALEHENVSKWVERPLPLSPAEEQVYQRLSTELQQAKQQIAQLNKQTNRNLVPSKKSIPISELAGVVVDDSQAKLVGNWTLSATVGPYVAAGYAHDGAEGKGQKTATFEPLGLPPGQYDVRLAYTTGTNRSPNASVRVFSADGEATLSVDQTKEPAGDGHFISLGNYRFEKDGQAFVLVSNADTTGHVIVDAVQFLLTQPAIETPVRSVAAGLAPSGDAANTNRLTSLSTEPTANNPSPPNLSPPNLSPPNLSLSSPSLSDAEREQLMGQLAELEKRAATLEKQLAERPKFLTLVEENAPQDIPIHIRGDVHNLGQTVPRGFLTALGRESTPTIGANSSGRTELAQWLSAADNPLTARVYANRVWSWLMGQGLVPSVNNFGTTGMPPTHPQLLDWLASELVQSGWSTKHLVRTIVVSQAYRRSLMEANDHHAEIDPGNTLYWRGQSRRLSAESLRDAMLRISGELDTTLGGSLIGNNVKDDYNYHHSSTRRSIYHPVFRNSLPELYEAFDFADTSVSIGQRPRSTVATQALVLLNHPWVATRAVLTAARLGAKYDPSDPQAFVRGLYLECLAREPASAENASCQEYLRANAEPRRIELLVHALFASLDFRYLD